MFTVVLDIERLLQYSPYFRAMIVYDGPMDQTESYTVTAFDELH